MPVRLNQSFNASFSVPGGFPYRLHVGSKTSMEGVIDSTVESITATLRCEAGTCDAHLALYTMPTTSGGDDGDVVEQVDSDGIGVTDTKVTITVPTDVAVAPYVFRLWVDNITGVTADETDRDGDSSATDEPAIPTGVSVESITII